MTPRPTRRTRRRPRPEARARSVDQRRIHHRGGEQLPVGVGRDYTAVKDSRECDPQFFARYGSRCREVSDYQAGDNSPLEHYPAMTCREVVFLAEKEKIVHLDDLVLRRSLMAYLGHLNRPLIDELAAILADVLGWDDKQKQAEIQRTLEILRDRHGVKL